MSSVMTVAEMFSYHPVIATAIIYLLLALVAAVVIGPILGDGFDCEDEDDEWRQR